MKALTSSSWRAPETAAVPLPPWAAILPTQTSLPRLEEQGPPARAPGGRRAVAPRLLLRAARVAGGIQVERGRGGQQQLVSTRPGQAGETGEVQQLRRAGGRRVDHRDPGIGYVGVPGAVGGPVTQPSRRPNR